MVLSLWPRLPTQGAGVALGTVPGSWVCRNRLLLEALGCPGSSTCLFRLSVSSGHLVC